MIGFKNLASVLQPMRSKIKTNRTFTHDFSRALSKLQVIARYSNWFIVLFAPAVIGRSNYLALLLRQSFENHFTVMIFIVPLKDPMNFLLKYFSAPCPHPP